MLHYWLCGFNLLKPDAHQNSTQNAVTSSDNNSTPHYTDQLTMAVDTHKKKKLPITVRIIQNEGFLNIKASGS